ncbi:GTP-binding protein lepA, putative [Eimeria brunetti]|uniref:GTP-binding protein lepA, putative n=1 Tax=Eimeria brunetti TaxID=51314 RepID=U6LEY4_9EIME|nr:GTP-binding protein lepA, putative [Eimeria brunetti]
MTGVRTLQVDLAESPEQLAELKKTVGELVGAPPETVLEVSAKTGKGIDELLEAIVQQLPSPAVKNDTRNLKALVFDSFYDAAKGVVLVAVIREGRIKAGDAVTAVGYICSNLRAAADIHVGDTLCLTQSPTPALPGFEPPKRLVYAGVYPEDPSEFEKLKVSLQRLMLTDAAVEAQPAVSQALGPGFRCGFLGALHMEVVHQRLEAEFGQRTVLTNPGVTFFLETADGSRIPVGSPAELPKGCRELLEPMAHLTVVAPMEFMAAIDRLAFGRRGERLECHILQQQQTMLQRHRETAVRLVYKLPLAEILVDFADKLQSVTSGAATFDVEEAGKCRLLLLLLASPVPVRCLLLTQALFDSSHVSLRCSADGSVLYKRVCSDAWSAAGSAVYIHPGYELSRVSSVCFMVNGEPIDVLGLLVHQSKAKEVAVRLTEQLGKAIPPQQFEVVVQGTVGGRIAARATVKALRKDVTAKCYGGDAEAGIGEAETADPAVADSNDAEAAVGDGATSAPAISVPATAVAGARGAVELPVPPL